MTLHIFYQRKDIDGWWLDRWDCGDPGTWDNVTRRDHGLNIFHLLSRNNVSRVFIGAGCYGPTGIFECGMEAFTLSRNPDTDGTGMAFEAA
jgi:hypothetical protein